MANQQLKEYVGQQLERGVGKEAIRSALVGVGWSEADIKDAMGETAPASPMAPVMPATKSAPFIGGASSPAVAPSAAPSASSPSPVAPLGGIKPSGSAPANAVPSVKPAATISFSSPAAAAPSSTVKSAAPAASAPTGNVMLKMNEMTFQPDGAKMVSSPAAEKPAAISMTPTTKVTISSSGKGWATTAIIFILLALGATGAAWYFWNQSTTLSAQLSQTSTVTPPPAAAVPPAQDAAQVADLQAKTDSLNAQVSDLLAQLSMFASAPGTASSALPITVKGTLSGGSGKAYTLATAQGAVAIVKNWKDAKVDAALKPLVGQQVTVSGTHAPSSRDITVTDVNGASLTAAVSPAPARAATTTTMVPAVPPAVSSTGSSATITSTTTTATPPPGLP